MKLLGFQEVRGTEGSSVRFDPPSDLDHVRALLVNFGVGAILMTFLANHFPQTPPRLNHPPKDAN